MFDTAYSIVSRPAVTDPPRSARNSLALSTARSQVCSLPSARPGATVGLLGHAGIAESRPSVSRTALSSVNHVAPRSKTMDPRRCPSVVTMADAYAPGRSSTVPMNDRSPIGTAGVLYDSSPCCTRNSKCGPRNGTLRSRIVTVSALRVTGWTISVAAGS